MIDALGYLVATSARNGFRARVRRLRQPRYAIALLLGGVYLWYFLVRPFGPAGARDSGMNVFGTAMEITLAALVTVLALSSWLSSRGKLALAYSPAEIHFLFTGPITRRGLLGYKLLRLQIPLLINAVLWVFILRRGGSALPGGLRFIGTWLVFATLFLHRLGAALTRTAWEEHGRAGVAKHRLTIAVLVLFLGAIGWSVIPAVRQAGGEAGAGIRAAIGALETFPASVAIAPTRWLLAPTLARSSAEWLREVPFALAILALHVLWVFRADVAFEEAAVRASEERMRLVEAMRERRSARAAPRAPRAARAGKKGRAPRTLPLGARGRASTAILWKNALALARATPPAGIIAVLAIALPIALGFNAQQGGSIPRFIGLVALGGTAAMLLLGARVVRNDLRLDMAQLELIKTLPLRGRTLVVAEVMSSTTALTAMQAALLAIAYLLLLGDPVIPLGAGVRLGIVVAVVPVLFLVNAVNLTIQNGFAVLFPAWMKLGPATGGVEVLGQGILLLLGSVLLVGIVFVPPALLVVGLLQPAMSLGGMPAILGLAVAALSLVLAELAGLVVWLGRSLERAEPSQVA